MSKRKKSQSTAYSSGEKRRKVSKRNLQTSVAEAISVPETQCNKSAKTKRISSPARNKSANDGLKEAGVCSGHSFSEEEVLTFRTNLLNWYDEVQRVLPWRTIAKTETDVNKRIYSIWVSEVMLQQTQVSTVVPYFNKWLSLWPSVQCLAAATLDEVHSCWAGLGYYSRATRLHQAAQLICSPLHGGQFPRSCEGLQRALVGVGRYTAGAIASIALGQVAPVVDGNVARVMARVRGVGARLGDKAGTEQYWLLAESILDAARPGDVNQALMELGATVCTHKNASCGSCPVSDVCYAYRRAAHEASRLSSRSQGLSSSHSSTRSLEDYFSAAPAAPSVATVPQDGTRKPERNTENVENAEPVFKQEFVNVEERGEKRKKEEEVKMVEDTETALYPEQDVEREPPAPADRINLRRSARRMLSREKKVQENKVQENKVQENKVQENKVQENMVQENKVQENKVQENKVQENKVQENKVQENTALGIHLNDRKPIESSAGKLSPESRDSNVTPLLGLGEQSDVELKTAKFASASGEASCVIGDIENVPGCRLCGADGGPWDHSAGVHQFPRPQVKAASRRQVTTVLALSRQQDGRLLVLRRPVAGLLANLWELVSLPGAGGAGSSPPAHHLSQTECEQLWTLYRIARSDLQHVQYVGHVVHVFSHIHQTYRVFSGLLASSSLALRGPPPATHQALDFLSPAEFNKAAVSTAMKKVLKAVQLFNKQKVGDGCKTKREVVGKKQQQPTLTNYFRNNN